MSASTVSGFPTRSTCTYSPKFTGSAGVGRIVTICRNVEAQTPIFAFAFAGSVGMEPSAVAEMIGISVDGIWCHLAFSKDRKLHIPLLADFEPKGEVARMYGVYNEKIGEADRALFVIDSEGVIRWSYVSPIGINPGADGILKALESIKK